MTALSWHVLGALAVASVHLTDSALPTVDYVRKYNLDGPLPLLQPRGDGASEQIKLVHAGKHEMKMSFLTPGDADAKVVFGLSKDRLTSSAGVLESPTQYSCSEATCGGPYQSGLIHRVVIKPVDPSTEYFYRIGEAGPVMSFTTAPEANATSSGFSFGVIGDLGQTSDSNNTVHHLLGSGAGMVLHAGDLSYADCLQPRWDSYGRLVNPLSSTKPWMTVAGNHEEEVLSRCGKSLNTTFASYMARYGAILPYKESGSDSAHFYSFETAGVHFLMLGSYVDFVSDEEAAKQVAWLKKDLATVDRSKTPFLVGVLHAPWYNSNEAHQNEPEEYNVRGEMEEILHAAGLDIMFAGHVHAYERSHPVFQQKRVSCGATFINIGDGGNREGLAKGYLKQPDWSAYREASFGHGVLRVTNSTHLKWEWHRDQDGERVVSDESWIQTCV